MKLSTSFETVVFLCEAASDFFVVSSVLSFAEVNFSVGLVVDFSVSGKAVSGPLLSFLDDALRSLVFGGDVDFSLWALLEFELSPLLWLSFDDFLFLWDLEEELEGPGSPRAFLDFEDEALSLPINGVAGFSLLWFFFDATLIEVWSDSSSKL